MLTFAVLSKPKFNNRGSWNSAGYNRLIIYESDRRMAQVLSRAREDAGLTKVALGRILHVHRNMIYLIEKADPSAVSWVRYLPKVMAWLKACNAGLQIAVIPNLNALEEWELNEAERIAAKERTRAAKASSRSKVGDSATEDI